MTESEAYERHLKKQQEKDALPERVPCAAVHYQDGKPYKESDAVYDLKRGVHIVWSGRKR